MTMMERRGGGGREEGIGLLEEHHDAPLNQRMNCKCLPRRRRWIGWENR